MRRNTFRVAFCGVITALALVFMLMTSLAVSIATFALPMLSGILLVTIVIEFGWKWALAAYGAVAVLSAFLAGDKEAVVYFVAFFGFYPIIKSLIERLKSKALQYVIKYAVFNVCVIGAFFVSKFLLMIPDEEFVLFGVYVPWVFLIIGEVVFIIYDLAVTVIVTNYVLRIRDKLFKGSYMK